MNREKHFEVMRRPSKIPDEILALFAEQMEV